MAEENNKMPNGQQENQSENLSKASIVEALGGIDNADLIDLLSEWRMDNSLYIYPLMEMKGYEIDYSYDNVAFKSPKGETFQVAVRTLKDLCFRAVKERSVDYRLDRLIVSYLQCNVQQTYCIFDPWGYFPNGNKEILAVEEPEVFIVDKQRKIAVSHPRLLTKLNELLQVNEPTNVKYNKLWQGYKESIANRYPEEFAQIILSDEPIRTALSKTFYHRDSYGICFVELSDKRVLRIPSHILKEFVAIRLDFVKEVVAEEPKQEKSHEVIKEQEGKSQEEKKPEQEAKPKAKIEEKAEPKAEQTAQPRSKGGSNKSVQANNRQSNNSRRGRNESYGRGGREAKSNPKFNADRYLISEDELNYIIPVGWRNLLLNWGCVGRFFLDIWMAIKLVGRIRKNRE